MSRLGTVWKRTRQVICPPIQARKPRKPLHTSATSHSSIRRWPPRSTLRRISTPSMAPWRKASATPSSTAQISSARVSTSLQSSGEDSTKRATTCQKPAATAPIRKSWASTDTPLNSQWSMRRRSVMGGAWKGEPPRTAGAM